VGLALRGRRHAHHNCHRTFPCCPRNP
jgi:hypothetical protein